jgi:hypothetical protein
MLMIFFENKIPMHVNSKSWEVMLDSNGSISIVLDTKAYHTMRLGYFVLREISRGHQH